MSLVVAHAGHWVTTVGFALAPLTVIAGIVALAVLERRRGAGGR
jgi:predicted lysophospholipase L1 biosynthesis ABC-type transport system permease subunit